MMKNTKVITFQVILPLIIGIFIYATLREQPPFKQYIPWLTPVFDVSFLPRFFKIFLVFRLPDMLWTFSFISALNLRLKNTLQSAFIVTSIFIIYEYFQYEGIFAGTGDVGDIFYSLCAVIIYILLFWRKNHEEKT